MNNFEDLYDHGNNFNPNQQKIEGDIWKTLGIIKFVGQIVDAYVPKLVDLFIVVSGGKANEPGSDYPDTDPSNDPNSPSPRNPDQWTAQGFKKRA